MKKIFLTLVSLLAFGAVGHAQSMKVYQNGELKAIYYVSKDDKIEFSDDFPFPGEDDPYNGHEYVDLGLPSGLKWATCNVGATQPEEYGDYFAWGETEGCNSGKTNFSWSNYKYCNGSNTTMTKYCTSDKYGTVDNKTVLEAADDAAAVNWGGSWRMPTTEEQQELLDNCTWTWTTKNGVYGCNLVGPNGNSIFLPAAGFRLDSHLDYAGSIGYYWSSSLHASNSSFAYCLYFRSSNQGWGGNNRYFGQSVRPVCQ